MAVQVRPVAPANKAADSKTVLLEKAITQRVDGFFFALILIEPTEIRRSEPNLSDEAETNHHFLLINSRQIISKNLKRHM